MALFASLADKIGGVVKGIFPPKGAHSSRHNPDSSSGKIMGNFEEQEGLYYLTSSSLKPKPPATLSISSSINSEIKEVKNLHQEAISEIMKLADKQGNIEDMLPFKFGKGWPSPKRTTQVKGIIDVVGFLMFGENDVQQSSEVLHRAGIKTGINTRLIFETFVRHKDSLIAEFVTGHGHALALENLMYSTHLRKLASSIFIALGAQGGHFATSHQNHKQVHCRSGFAPSWPPLFDQHHDGAIGISFKRSKIKASFTELFSGIGMPHDSSSERTFLSTFARVSYQPSEEVRVNISGLWQSPATGFMKFGTLAVPLNNVRQQTGSSGAAQASKIKKESVDTPLTKSPGAIAIMLDSEVDDGTKLGVWLEVQKSNSGILKWGMFLSDIPYEEVGWGLKVRGMAKGQLDLQMEAFLHFSLGSNFMLQPGVVYVTEGRTRIPAFIFQSSWCM
ncbi:uncharacterized protein LOC122038457 isoform X1 [Zingiber officinale]|uniref:uncharacterized protein LOC122038457 isoform X1 n=1 Tax=Zingiber officinale TaxID=94328 RepID=UPI001C4ACA41|nr:uncharacterized protein LOC122038457 isoform X1 [Zingiber officinale]